MSNAPLDRLRYHVSGAIARGESEAITEVPVSLELQAFAALCTAIAEYTGEDSYRCLSDTPAARVAVMERAHRLYYWPEDDNLDCAVIVSAATYAEYAKVPANWFGLVNLQAVQNA